MLEQPLEVFAGLWRITLPLPFELSSVNVYLVRLNDGWMLIDCGLRTEESFAALSRQLEAIGVPFASIRRILLTHTHPDHVGQARRLLELTGAELWMSGEELNQVTRVAQSGAKPLWLDSVLGHGGVPMPLVERIQSSFDRIRDNFQEQSPHRILEDGDTVESALGPFEVILTPGHSPGHVCLYQRERRALIAGDHLLETITPNIGWLPDRNALGDFFASLQLIHPLAIDLILPGHGDPFRGHREWIVSTRGHHEERFDRIMQSLAAGPRTAHDLVADIWARTLAPFHHRFAVFEVLAHLEHLRLSERVAREVADERWIWRALIH